MTILERINATSDPLQLRGLLAELLTAHEREIGEMKAQQRVAADVAERTDKMLAEFRVADAKAREAQVAAAMERKIDGPEAELRDFAKSDGTVRMVGEESPTELYQPGLLDTRRVSGEWHAEMRRLWSIRSVARAQLKRTPKIDAALHKHALKGPREFRSAFESDTFKRSIFDGTTAAQGSEWVPSEGIVPDVDLAVMLLSDQRIGRIFRTIEMTSAAMNIPLVLTGGTPYLQGDMTVDPAVFTPSLPQTGEAAITPANMAVNYPIGLNASEDSIVDVWPLFARVMTEDLVDGEEDAIINGDTAATHQDTGLSTWNIGGRWSAASGAYGGPGDHRKAWIGLRARAFDISNTADGSSIQTFDGAMSLRARLAVGHSAAYITGEAYMYKKMATFDEVQTSLSTVSRVADGRVASLMDEPVYLSKFMAADQAATGLYTGSGAYASMICAAPSRFARFRRRGAMVEITREAPRGVAYMTATYRGTFKPVDKSTALNVALHYKLLG